MLFPGWGLDTAQSFRFRLRKLEPGPNPPVEDAWKRAGMLPFRIDQCYAQLVKSIRDKRLGDKPGQFRPEPSPDLDYRYIVMPMHL